MNKNVLIGLIIVGFLIISIFPILGLISLFEGPKITSDEESLIKLKTSETKVEKISNSGSINLDELTDIEEIIEEEVPLAQEASLVTAEQMVRDFKAHSNEIEKGDLVFEVVTQEGDNLFFTTLEEIETFATEDKSFTKSFVLDENSKLERYTYLVNAD